MTGGAREKRIFRIGIHELNGETGELRKDGLLRFRLQAQPLQVLLLLLENPGEVASREDLRQRIWPADTFVDFDHGVNTAINKLRAAFGDSAANPRFIQTLPRIGYRFIAPVEVAAAGAKHEENQAAAAPVESAARPPGDPVGAFAQPPAGASAAVLSHAADLPSAPRRLTRALFSALQLMYLVFYLSALANLSDAQLGLAALMHDWRPAFAILVLTAAAGIPVRLYLLAALGFRYGRLARNFLRIFPGVLVLDELWSLAPFLLTVHYARGLHLGFGLALAATAALVYSPFAQRSLLLMDSARQG